MWDLFFTIALFVGFQTAAAIWTGTKMPSLLPVGLAAAACLSVGIAALFAANRIWLLAALAAGHIVYVIVGAACHRAADAFAAVSICLTTDMLLIPFAACGVAMKSYSFYGLMLLLSLIFAGLYKINDSAKQWPSAVKEGSTVVYAILFCVPVPAAAVQALVLLLCRPHGEILKTVGVYALLLLVAAATVLLQRLCACTAVG